jgi:hypothetical protein
MDRAPAHRAAGYTFPAEKCLGHVLRLAAGASFMNATTREVGWEFSKRINSHLETPIPVLYKER